MLRLVAIPMKCFQPEHGELRLGLENHWIGYSVKTIASECTSGSLLERVSILITGSVDAVD